MAFGSIGEQHMTAKQRAAEQQAKYRAERKRQADKFEFEQFCKRQRERIAATLKRHTDRVNRARWGNPLEDRGLFAVTKAGTTECSAPVKRMYQEQAG